MKKVLIVLNIINILLLSAHSLRHYGLIWALIPFIALVFFRLNSPLKEGLWVIFYFIVISIWSLTTVEFVSFRLAMHLPYQRLAWIMGSVLCLNIIPEVWYLHQLVNRVRREV